MSESHHVHTFSDVMCCPHAVFLCPRTRPQLMIAGCGNSRLANAGHPGETESRETPQGQLGRIQTQTQCQDEGQT